MNYLLYIISASICIGAFYAAYLLFRKGFRFSHARIYILASLMLSLIIPLSGYKIDIGFKWPVDEKHTFTVTAETQEQLIIQTVPVVNTFWEHFKNIDYPLVSLYICITVTILLILRLVFSVLFIYIRFRKSFKVHLPDCILLYNHGFGNTLSFFRWIFVQPGNIIDDDLEKIIAHEKIHVSQLHSADILGIELLSAVMWFNPFIWMMKSSMKLVHEYLADEGALLSGISIKGYQAILLNQVAEERLIVLSSRFNHSLIKKRITMMTRTNNEGKSPLKLLSILPVAIMLFVLTAALNGIFSKDASALETDNHIVTGVNPLLLSTGPDLPPDTIIKKTIIKKVSKSNPTDTVVIDKEEIITGDDVIILKHMEEKEHGVIILDDGELRHTGEGRRREVRVHIDTTDVVRHGNVRITDEPLQGDQVKHVSIRRSGDKDIVDEKVIIVDKWDHDSNILYVVDGVKMTDKEAMEILIPDEIRSISVLKDEDAAKYGGNYSGVLIITTKKQNK